MLFHKKKQTISYDASLQEPAVRKNICTGEMTAGLLDRDTGRFHELMKIESLEEFAEQVGTDQIRMIY